MDVKLDILNAMLGSVGSNGITSTVGRHPGLIKALPILERENRTLQARGHWFNTDWGLKLLPTVDKEFLLPQNTLKADTTIQRLPYVRRGRQMYDPRKHTKAIDEEFMLLNVVVQLDYDDLPIAAIDVIRAEAIWQLVQPNADGQTLQSRKSDRQVAMQSFERERLSQADFSLRDNPSYARIIGGINPQYTNRMSPNYMGGRT